MCTSLLYKPIYIVKNLFECCYIRVDFYCLFEDKLLWLSPSVCITITYFQARLQQMYAQIVYKDKNLLELNNKIMELERRLIDLQEFVGEKNEVIRGRDKVIQVK